MLSKILKLSDFGIFKNFAWNDSINTFTKKNLIYGWNYSGKTTLSKLFHNLEKRSALNFNNATYSLEMHGGDVFTEDSLHTFPSDVKVFNINYVTNVFSWEVADESSFAPIMFYLGEKASDIQPRIDTIKDYRLPLIEKIKNKHSTAVQTFNEYQKDGGNFSKQATNIRRFLNDRIKTSDFNKRHLTERIPTLLIDTRSYLLNDTNLNSLHSQATETNNFAIEQDNIIFKEHLCDLIEKTKLILDETIVFKKTILDVQGSAEVFNWVQTGLDLHRVSTKCKFCDNTLDSTRIETLNDFFSNKLLHIQNDIKNLKRFIADEQEGLKLSLPHHSNFPEHLKFKYIAAIKSFEEKKSLYLKQLEILHSDLERKEKNIFKSIIPTQVICENVSQELNAIKEILRDHNSYVKNFDECKSSALKSILDHYVAEYILVEDYINILADSNIAQTKIAKCEKITAILKNDLKILEASLKDTVKGKEELNSYLQIFLGRDDIRIDIVDSKFILYRGLMIAKHLSEGEKTAIAFSYFLTELKSLQKEHKLKNTIIYFDDPISSLDSNHIFQVRSLIQYLFAKEDDYLQLFISTHNFEFFSIMLDCNLFKNQNKSTINELKCPYYLINRKSNDNSTIKNLPKSLRSHKSEYVHLFNILNTYNLIDEKEDFEYRILLPNALRRFIELYSLFKYPKGFSEIDERIKIIFSSQERPFHNLKLMHWFSHQNQFEKVAQHDSKIMLIDEAIADLMHHIKENDKLHWEGLTT